MLESLKKEVCAANLELVERGLVIYTWGNVSGIDRNSNFVVIKPSGIDYSKMTSDDMVVVDLKTGETIEGKWKPSSDTETHLEIYKAFPQVGGITHMHSTYTVAYAQAGLPIRALGTTQADYFFGDIPCTREMTEEEVKNNYERNTGKIIVEQFLNDNINPMDIPGILVRNHGPFVFGIDAAQSVFNAVVMEKVAEINFKTEALNPHTTMPQCILEKHYYRKHGVNAYYGQK